MKAHSNENDEAVGPNGAHHLVSDPRTFLVRPNFERGFAALDTLLATFRAREYPFHRFVSFVKPHLEQPLPEDPLLRARFWFLLCFWMRGRIESYEALWRLARVWHDDPKVFDPAFWAKTTEKKRARLVAVLAKHRLSVGVDKYHKSDWPLNMAKLHRFWDGDPRKLISGADTFDDLLTRIQNHGKFSPERPEGFRGFQRKMVAMIAHFLSADDLARAKHFPFPPDIQVIRLLLYQGALEVWQKPASSRGKPRRAPEFWDVRYEGTVGPAIDLCLSYMAARGLDAVELGDAVWNFGGMMCAEAPQNRWELVERAVGRKTRLRPIPVDPESVAIQRRFAHTCANCCVRDTCIGGTIGEGPYAYWGTFSRRPSLDLREHFAAMMSVFGVPPSSSPGKNGRAWDRMAGGKPLGPGTWLDRATKPKPVLSPSHHQPEFAI